MLAWIAVSVVSALVIAAVILALLPIKVPREPEREGWQDPEAARAYARQGRSPVFVMERYLVLRALARWKPRGLVLDIGSGPGFLASGIKRRHLAARVIGLDNNSEMINIARRTWQTGPYDMEFIKGDAHRLPFANGTADFVVSSLSLHHWADAGKVFKEIKRVLKPGGRFLIYDLRRDGPLLFYYALKIGQALSSRDIRRTNGAVGSFWSSYTPSELETILSATGIADICIEPRFGWMLARGKKLAVGQKITLSLDGRGQGEGEIKS